MHLYSYTAKGALVNSFSKEGGLGAFGGFAAEDNRKGGAL
jgi:hypothetical protein